LADQKIIANVMSPTIRLNNMPSRI